MSEPPESAASEPIVRESSRIGLNLAALVGARFACLAMTLVQMGITFRALGVEGTGQFGFALGYASLFSVLATLGIQRLLVRDIARDRAIAWTYVWTAAAVVAVLSLMVFALVAASTLLFEPDPVVRQAVAWAAVSLILVWSLQSPFEALITSHERMVYVAVSYTMAGVAKLALVYAVLARYPSSAAAHAAIAAANTLGLAACVAFAIHVAGWERPRVRLSLALRQVRECVPFFIAMVLSQIYFRSDMSVLRFMRGDHAAGIYTPVQRVLEPLLMISAIWGAVVFPALCRLSVASEQNYAKLKKMSLRLALLAAFPMGAGLMALAGPALALLVGGRMEEFAPSVGLMRVMCVIVPFFYLNGVGQEFLYSAHRNWLVVHAYAAGAAVNVAVNIVAIHYLGAYGVAAGAIAANGLISALFVRAMRGEFGGMRLPSLTAKTIAACAVMGALAYGLAAHSLALAVVAGAVIYAVAQLALRTLTPEEREIARSMLGRVRLPFRRSARAGEKT